MRSAKCTRRFYVAETAEDGQTKQPRTDAPHAERSIDGEGTRRIYDVPLTVVLLSEISSTLLQHEHIAIHGGEHKITICPD